jgi:hypothetical protein
LAVLIQDHHWGAMCAQRHGEGNDPTDQSPSQEEVDRRHGAGLVMVSRNRDDCR